jgi:hypothetical protein
MICVLTVFIIKLVFKNNLRIYKTHNILWCTIHYYTIMNFIDIGISHAFYAYATSLNKRRSLYNDTLATKEYKDLSYEDRVNVELCGMLNDIMICANDGKILMRLHQYITYDDDGNTFDPFTTSLLNRLLTLQYLVRGRKDDREECKWYALWGSNSKTYNRSFEGRHV